MLEICPASKTPPLRTHYGPVSKPGLAGSDRPRNEDARRARALETRLEKSEVFGLVGESQSAHAVASLMHGRDAFRGHVHVRLRVHASRDRQPDELQLRPPVLSRERIATRRDHAALHRSDA